jgi:hypothetical protein
MVPGICRVFESVTFGNICSKAAAVSAGIKCVGRT